MATTADIAHAHAAHEAHDGHDVPKHDYHLVDPSPWPAIGSVSAFVLTLGAASWMHQYAIGGWMMILGFVGVLGTMIGWWREVLRESKVGYHKSIVNRGLRMGMALFIVSEVLFFFSFFWAFFYSALLPPEVVPAAWPPPGITPIEALNVPLLNTMILLLSGATVTWAHHAIKEDDNRTAFKALLLTAGLGAIFSSLQAYEYVEAYREGLKLQSGSFGSTFFMATGFHGFHVLVGTTFLIVCTMRAWYAAFRPAKHVGFEAAAWYWHFVDVVWLFLFVSVYIWGGSLQWTSPGTGG